ncbi:MAG: DUF2934 domain-containing protein [Methylomicrobium sp.]|jgi:hypothetical protein
MAARNAKVSKGDISMDQEQAFNQEEFETNTDLNARIAEMAYFKAEQRGFAPGHELDDWCAAEQEINISLR